MTPVIEEYRGRLYDVFLPARMVSGLISTNLSATRLIFHLAGWALGALVFTRMLYRRERAPLHGTQQVVER